MINTKMTFAVLALVSGFAGLSQVAHAGEGSFMLGHSTFENRCDANGGAFSPEGEGFACELDNVRIDCVFIGADSFCGWTGPQNQREVSRVLGAARAETLAEGGDGVAKKKKYGKDFVLNDQIKWKP